MTIPNTATRNPSPAPDSCWIATYSGWRVNPLAMRPDDVNSKDIAHALANLCRFNGHVPRFYSVAQHSVYVARYLAEVMGQSRTVALWGLLHDAAEAYLGDICSPLKRRLMVSDSDSDDPERVWGASFAAIETDILRDAIAPAFGLPWPMPITVHHADRVLLATEARSLMCADLADWGGLDDVAPWPEGPVLFDCLPPAEAERAFLVALEHYLGPAAA